MALEFAPFQTNWNQRRAGGQAFTTGSWTGPILGQSELTKGGRGITALYLPAIW